MHDGMNACLPSHQYRAAGSCERKYGGGKKYILLVARFQATLRSKQENGRHTLSVGSIDGAQEDRGNLIQRSRGFGPGRA
jgi:hypothetical protein